MKEAPIVKPLEHAGQLAVSDSRITDAADFVRHSVVILGARPRPPVAKVNPLTYLVDILRSLMVQGGENAFGVGRDLGVQVVGIAAKLYSSVVAWALRAAARRGREIDACRPQRSAGACKKLFCRRMLCAQAQLPQTANDGLLSLA